MGGHARSLRPSRRRPRIEEATCDWEGGAADREDPWRGSCRSENQPSALGIDRAGCRTGSRVRTCFGPWRLPRVKPGDPVGHAVLASLETAVSRIQAIEQAAGQGDSEGIHRLRTTTRRLRASCARGETWSIRTGSSRSTAS